MSEEARYRLASWIAFTGDKQIPTATVSVEVDGEERPGTDYGEGSVDALFKAIRSAANEECTAGSFSISSGGIGTEGEGTANVTVIHGSITSPGVGRSNDILEAAALAYVDAMSNLYKERKKKRGMAH